MLCMCLCVTEHVCVCLCVYCDLWVLCVRDRVCVCVRAGVCVLESRPDGVRLPAVPARRSRRTYCCVAGSVPPRPV